MARLMREFGSQNGSFGLAGDIYLLFWAALFTLCIISTIIFSCSDGMSTKDRNSTADVELYGAGCAAGCGAGCGA
ncbi:hypothetical protein SDJN03_20273, partial [Cucurbita argyrosperma subsp. sororia]